MPTAEQNLKKALAEAKDNTNAFDALQAQIDLIADFITRRKK